jgi:hypothetical protein
MVAMAVSQKTTSGVPHVVRFSEGQKGSMTSFPYTIRNGPLPGFTDITIQDQYTC